MFCNIPQNITWNLFQSIPKTICLNIVSKFGENSCTSIASDYMAINEIITHILQVKTCKNVKETHFMIANDTPHYIES